MHPFRPNRKTANVKKPPVKLRPVNEAALAAAAIAQELSSDEATL